MNVLSRKICLQWYPLLAMRSAWHLLWYLLCWSNLSQEVFLEVIFLVDILRRHDICDSTRRHSSKQWPTDLRTGNGCLSEHPKIQSHGGRLVGYIDKHDGHLILSRNNHTWFQIHEYGNPVRECHLVEGNKEGQSPGEWRVWWGLESNTTHPVRA
jgi:hypothetical protein